jgi:hypothetical protein
MRKWTSAIIVFAFLITPLQISQAANPKPGLVCSKLNLKQTFLSVKYTCIKVGKKLVWNKGVAITVPETQNSSLQTPVVLITPKEGDVCTAKDPNELKVPDGILYCVPISDGTSKYIEHFTIDPKISNPVSPEPLEACETPDLRGAIPPQMSILRTTHDSVAPSSIILKHNGILHLLAIPIDFPDAVGTADPQSLYGKDFEILPEWFSAYSNNKLKVVVDFKNKWFRAPLPAKNYDVTLASIYSSQDQFNLIQNYINLTSEEVNYSDADAVIFIYPKNASTSPGYLMLWGANFQSNGKSIPLSVLSSLGTANKYEPFWQWMAHEFLHQMGLAMHSPANPPGWGVEWGRYSYDEGLLPWNQMILDWLNQDQYYCVSAQNLTPANITLVPQESELPGIRTVLIRVSNTESLMVVSYRNDKWAYNTPASFYGTMVALMDTSKQNDMSGESNPDAFDGIKYQRPGIWLHPQNNVNDDDSWTNEHTGEGGALMYLGDVVTYKGINIKLVHSDNYDTVQISKS